MSCGRGARCPACGPDATTHTHRLMFWRVVIRRNSVSDFAAASVFCFGWGLRAECIHRSPVDNIWPDATRTCRCLCFWCLVVLQNSVWGDFNNFEVWLLVRLEGIMRSHIANRQHMAGWESICLGLCFGVWSCGGISFLKFQQLSTCLLRLVAGALGRPQP